MDLVGKLPEPGISTTYGGGDKREDRTAHSHLRDTFVKVSLNPKGMESLSLADNLSGTFDTA